MSAYSKYVRGSKIESLDDLVQAKFIWSEHGLHHKVYHSGWFLSWQLQSAIRAMQQGHLYTAEPKPKEKIPGYAEAPWKHRSEKS